MSSSEGRRPLRRDVELFENLIDLARVTQWAQQALNLDWASGLIEEVQHHPKVLE